MGGYGSFVMTTAHTQHQQNHMNDSHTIFDPSPIYKQVGYLLSARKVERALDTRIQRITAYPGLLYFDKFQHPLIRSVMLHQQEPDLGTGHT